MLLLKGEKKQRWMGHLSKEIFMYTSNQIIENIIFPHALR